jgi:hypothetical protein
VSVVFLPQSKIATFSNPSGPDFSSYVSDVKDRFWQLIHKCLDLIAFITSDIQRKSAASRMGKAVDSVRRV